MKPYPFTFQPIYKERIWGGTKLKTVLHKSFDGNQIGESWELSTVANDISIIANGLYEGKSISDLITQFPT